MPTDSELLEMPITELLAQKLLREGLAAKDRRVATIRAENAAFKTANKGMARPNIIKDTLGEGVKGVKSHLDGKTYDSKSEYYKSLKQSGHIVVEPGMQSEKRKQRGNYDVSKDLKRAAQQIGFI